MKKIIAIFAALIGMITMANQAHASQLLGAKVAIDDPSVDATSNYTFTFTQPSNATLGKITFEFCRAASGSCVPTNTTITSMTSGALNGLTAANWSATGVSNVITYTKKDLNGEGVSQNAVLSMAFGNISNGGLDTACSTGGLNGGVQPSNSSTCYIRINTYQENQTTAQDNTVITYTRVVGVTVSATVDPTFAFTVLGVASGAVTNSSITNSVTSTFNELPFGNLTVGSPKYAAQLLKVQTNTTSGYTVSAFMSKAMTGVGYTSNNIDPFVAAWSAPTVWTSPTGQSANDNTGWLGANTTDAAHVSGFTAGVAKFGGVGGTAVTVMRNDRPDNGSTPVYVTYAVEANVFQPADNYQGTLVYNALPTY